MVIAVIAIRILVFVKYQSGSCTYFLCVMCGLFACLSIKSCLLLLRIDGEPRLLITARANGCMELLKFNQVHTDIEIKTMI